MRVILSCDFILLSNQGALFGRRDHKVNELMGARATEPWGDRATAPGLPGRLDPASYYLVADQTWLLQTDRKVRSLA